MTFPPEIEILVAQVPFKVARSNGPLSLSLIYHTRVMAQQILLDHKCQHGLTFNVHTPSWLQFLFLLQFFNLSTALSATLKLLYQISLHQDLCLPLIVRNYWSGSSSKTFSSRQDFLPMSDQASAEATTEAPFFSELRHHHDMLDATSYFHFPIRGSYSSHTYAYCNKKK